MDLQVVIFDGLPVEKRCIAWAESVGDVAMASDIDEPSPHAAMIDVWANRVCQWFLDKTDKTHLLMLEHSKLPDANTIPVVQSTADVVGAEYCLKDGTIAHDGPGYLGRGCLRISRRALEIIPKPWFQFVLTADGMNIEKCSCAWFCDQAMAAGIHPVRVGHIARVTKAVITPAEGKNVNICLYSTLGNNNGDKKR